MKKKLFWILYICMIFFIWGNSLLPANNSSMVSGGLSYGIYQFLHLTMDFDIFHSFIRKCAHFSEYALLGIIGMNCSTKENQIKMILLCIGISCLDETIQLFVEGRSGQLSDVLIDSCGTILGYFTAKISQHLFCE